MLFRLFSSYPTTVRPGEKMDPTIQDEVPAAAASAVAENSSAAVEPAGVVNGNGTLESSTTADGDAAPAAAPESYDDLFPSLSSSQPDAGRGKTMGEWSKRPAMFASSVVTQVKLRNILSGIRVKILKILCFDEDLRLFAV